MSFSTVQPSNYFEILRKYNSVRNDLKAQYREAVVGPVARIARDARVIQEKEKVINDAQKKLNQPSTEEQKIIDAERARMAAEVLKQEADRASSAKTQQDILDALNRLNLGNPGAAAGPAGKPPLTLEPPEKVQEEPPEYDGKEAVSYKFFKARGNGPVNQTEIKLDKDDDENPIGIIGKKKFIVPLRTLSRNELFLQNPDDDDDINEVEPKDVTPGLIGLLIFKIGKELSGDLDSLTVDGVEYEVTTDDIATYKAVLNIVGYTKSNKTRKMEEILDPKGKKKA